MCNDVVAERTQPLARLTVGGTADYREVVAERFYGTAEVAGPAAPGSVADYESRLWSHLADMRGPASVPNIVGELAYLYAYAFGMVTSLAAAAGTYGKAGCLERINNLATAMHRIGGAL